LELITNHSINVKVSYRVFPRITFPLGKICLSTLTGAGGRWGQLGGEVR